MENLKNIWKPELYRIQMEAPVPKRIICENCPDRPEFYGKEYHGIIGHKEATLLLENEPNGAFLIRKGKHDNDFYTLTWRFNGKVHHYKLYYDTTHYIKEKRYDTIYDLVADGLITCHMEVKAHHILEMINSRASYTESPYVTLNRRKLKTLSQQVHQASNRSSPLINKLTKTEKDMSDDFLKKPLDLTPTIEDNPLVIKYSKSHGFKVHTFKGLNWCEFCANFLWGFTAQGVKCEDCGFIAHSKCSERVPAHCVPDLKKLRGVFGIDLTTLLNAHSSTLPFVVRRCVIEIEARGLDSEGIYRVSGFADEIEALKLAFDRDGESADLSLYSNINVVAGTLKLYLRLLPVPLITYEVHPKLVQAIQTKTPANQIAKLRECLDCLPPAHFNCLQYMVQHLHRVSQQAELNKMSSHNLSTVFAPTLVATPPAITDLSFEIRALQRSDDLIIEDAHMFIIPGLEGHHGRFKALCKRLKIAAAVLQLGYENQNETIQEMAQRFSNVIMHKLKYKNHFYLLGYEYGVPVVLEIAAILESHGMTGTVYCLGGSPEEIRKDVENRLDGFTESKLQNHIIQHFCLLATQNTKLDLSEPLNSQDFEDKVRLCIKKIQGQTPFNRQYLSDVTVSAYKRIGFIRNYTYDLPALKSKVILIRAKTSITSNFPVTASFELHVQLQDVLGDLKCPSIVNSHLGINVLDEFNNKNICQSYLTNGDDAFSKLSIPNI